jgi:hypothetical protein
VTPGQNLSWRFAAVIEIPMGSKLKLHDYTVQRRKGFYVKA